MRNAPVLTTAGPISGPYDDGVITADDGTYEVGVDGRLLPPCTPSTVYCVGRNYAETLSQMEYEQPAAADFFIKPPTSLVGHEQSIPYPEFTEEVTYAGELAAVVGERCRDVTPEEVPDVVEGYTIMNDVDALDQQGRTARKALDGSGRFETRSQRLTGNERRRSMGGSMKLPAFVLKRIRTYSILVTFDRSNRELKSALNRYYNSTVVTIHLRHVVISYLQEAL